ncbi:MAG: NTP transferase domain-containing protein [Candidatus Moraniibacteriota bacterium]|nr:MAG: NTP transferase domain-containing protein [Candidatus Moranbacteria bacterium]
MKGIILAGGSGTRLLPLTATTSKQLLPIYDRQMIFYPLNTLIKAGIKDILIIVSPDHSGQFLNLLGSLFLQHGVKISFMVQKVPRGLADAFILGEDFLDEDNVVMILGDNVFEDDFTEAITSFTSGGRIFATKVNDPERFGVVEFNKEGKVISIEEKPEKPKSQYAIPGIYIFDKRVSKIASEVKPSARGEIEITEIHNVYLKEGMLDIHILEGKWFDTGTFETLMEASLFAKNSAMGEKFDPIVNEAISEYNDHVKRMSKSITFGYVKKAY